MMENSIPVDLIIEIHLRLPAKQVARCRCVSKLWRSVLGQPYFTELFLTRSLARPRLLIGTKTVDGKWSFFSSPQPHNPYGKQSSTVVAADFIRKFSKGIGLSYNGYASGMIYFREIYVFPKLDNVKRLICNPITGRYASLPELKSKCYRDYIGFDPIAKEYKVLVMNTSDCVASSDTVHHILTLASGNMKWRNIKCPFTHEPTWRKICINGVLYYSAICPNRITPVVVCFDLSSEEFKFIIEAERPQHFGNYDRLINYKGKFCGIYLRYKDSSSIKLHMYVLENVEKQEWSNYSYTFSEMSKLFNDLVISGATATGDIVMSTMSVSKPLYVYFFNLERGILQQVEIQGVGDIPDCSSVYVYVDYVEDLTVVDALQLESSGSVNDALQLKSRAVKQDRYIVTERPKPQEQRTHHLLMHCSSSQAAEICSHRESKTTTLPKKKEEKKKEKEIKTTTTQLYSLCWLSYSSFSFVCFPIVFD